MACKLLHVYSLGIRLYKDNVIALLAYRYIGRLGNVGSDLQGCVEQMTTWNVRVSRGDSST